MFLRHGTPALLILALCASACGAATGQAPALANPTHPSAATAASATASGPTATAAASPVPPTESPAPRDFSEPFSGNPKYWAFVEVDNGQPYTKPAVQDGFLVYGLPAANQWAYGLYTGAHYTNVRIETEVQSRTTGDGALGLRGGAAHGALEDVDDQPVEEHFIADAQRVEVALHFGVGGVPILQRPARDSSGRFAGAGRQTQSGLQR